MIYYNSFNLPYISNFIIATKDAKVIYIGKSLSFIESLAENINIDIKKDINSNVDIFFQLQEYFQKERKSFDIKTEFLTGTNFQKQVWKSLLSIPYGSTISYKTLALINDNPNAYRAVGNANSKNPIPIIYPCHRVINANNTTGGYSLGIELKKQLLNMEKTTRQFS